ncbi:hypothetical protein [Sciscionella marina]|uniref:hypothetical protein n=1 Tax=Sciscionella marina TaxID=508770 RepID=UPI00037EF676|nr:hypothetical protein [Sciscionella marina]
MAHPSDDAPIPDEIGRVLEAGRARFKFDLSPGAGICLDTTSHDHPTRVRGPLVVVPDELDAIRAEIRRRLARMADIAAADLD